MVDSHTGPAGKKRLNNNKDSKGLFAKSKNATKRREVGESRGVADDPGMQVDVFCDNFDGFLEDLNALEDDDRA